MMRLAFQATHSGSKHVINNHSQFYFSRDRLQHVGVRNRVYKARRAWTCPPKVVTAYPCRWIDSNYSTMTLVSFIRGFATGSSIYPLLARREPRQFKFFDEVPLDALGEVSTRSTTAYGTHQRISISFSYRFSGIWTPGTS